MLLCYCRTSPTQASLWDLIEFPRFFSYSLEDRIISRHKVMLENRVNFKLRYMLASTDEKFNQRVRAAVERRQIFESGTLTLETCTHNDAADSDTTESSLISEADMSSFESKDSSAVLLTST